jgi:hypothetical protein
VPPPRERRPGGGRLWGWLDAVGLWRGWIRLDGWGG